MMSRSHPVFGWLWLPRDEWSRTLDRCLQERDQLNDANHAGHPPAFVTWCRVVQMPELAKRYRKQFDDRIESLQMLLANVQASIAGGRLDRQHEADQLSAEITWLSELVA
jgi:hypothetical protein